MDEVAARVSDLTAELLIAGANPCEVAFALTSVATDMGLQIQENTLQVFSVLLKAIASQADSRIETNKASKKDKADSSMSLVSPNDRQVH